MRTAAVAFILSLITSAGLTPLVRYLAHRFGAVDHALSSRKVHKDAIPRLGGIAIVCAFFAPLVGLLYIDSGVGRIFLSDERHAVGIFLGGAAIALLGVYDDLKGAGAKTKFAVQFAVAGGMYALGFRIDEIANPFGPSVALGWLGLPFTLLWIAGVINAMNLIDGLDGLAGGVALVKIAITLVFALLHDNPLMILFAAAFAGAILGFLRYNFNPATIFMGDTGSMFLGFVLAVSAIHMHHKTSTAIPILIPIVALGFPIADTLLAMWRRGVRGVPLFQADREHIHHRLLASGLTQLETTLVLYGVSAVLGGVAVALTYATRIQAAALLLLVAALAVTRLRHLGFIHFERTAEVLKIRRRNLFRRAVLRDVGAQLKRAAEVGTVWESVKSVAPALGADCVSLRIEQPRPYFPPKPRAYTLGFDESGLELYRTFHPLRGERPEANVLELGWTGGPDAVDHDTKVAVDMLCDHVRDALVRIERDALSRPARYDGARRDTGKAMNAIGRAERREKVVS